MQAVEQSNRMALFAGLGTPEVVQADNARAALFLAMAHARLEQHDEACRWLTKARRWIDGEGRRFQSRLPGSEAQRQAPAERSPSAIDLADRMFLADALFELQVLDEEAGKLVDCGSP